MTPLAGQCPRGVTVTVPSGIPVILNESEKPAPEASKQQMYERATPRHVVDMLPPEAPMAIFEGRSNTTDAGEPAAFASDAASIIARTAE